MEENMLMTIWENKEGVSGCVVEAGIAGYTLCTPAGEMIFVAKYVFQSEWTEVKNGSSGV